VSRTDQIEGVSVATSHLKRACILAGAAAIVLSFAGRPAWGYIEVAYTIGKMMAESTNIVVVQVEAVDKEKNTIVYRKVRDLKGVHNGEQLKHNIAKGGFHPREWQTIMAWAEVGKTAVFFHNGGAGEMCIDNYWYQVYAGDWWSMSHGEPYLLRTYAGKPEKLIPLVTAMLAGQEVIVPCMVDGDKNALQLRAAKVMRIRAGTKILDYDRRTLFAGWGAEEFRAIGDMPGFTHYAPLNRVDPEALGIAPTDVDGDGKPDFCLFGAGRLFVLQNSGGSFTEVPLAADVGGARAAAWADYDGDGKADLLLATPQGPRLFHNEGGKFRDVSDVLPRLGYHNLTAAAWIDYDGDKRPDILLADGFRGLRLYRNVCTGPQPSSPPPPQLPAAPGAAPVGGPWRYAGPFDNTNGAGFDAVYPPEKEIDFSKEYAGKNGEKVGWKEGPFSSGTINNLALFKPVCNENAVVYMCREIESPGAMDVPATFGSDDGLAVWINGAKIVSENVSRSCEPDQVAVTLKLKPGKNVLLLKVTQTTGQFAYYYSIKWGAAATATATAPAAVAARPVFEDVSEKAGLPALGMRKGDHLAVADVNADGRPDFLFSAGTGLLAINTPQGFVEAKDSGISYQCGKVAPAFGDFDGDKSPDLFVPQQGKSRLFRNNGKGRFSDVTASAGALGLPLGHATCAAWADFNNRGRMDLLVGFLKGPNRFFRNNGNGTFADATEEIGLNNRIFNTRDISVLDINKDGVMDVVFINEGQESAVLLGNPARPALAAAKDAASNPLESMGTGTLNLPGNPLEPAGTGTLDLLGNPASPRRGV
jgi:hypothetical protein